jgi:hypothetical protein
MLTNLAHYGSQRCTKYTIVSFNNAVLAQNNVNSEH